MEGQYSFHKEVIKVRGSKNVENKVRNLITLLVFTFIIEVKSIFDRNNIFFLYI